MRLCYIWMFEKIDGYEKGWLKSWGGEGKSGKVREGKGERE